MTRAELLRDIPPREVLSGENFAAACDDVYWSAARAGNPVPVGRSGARSVFTQSDHVFTLFRVLRRQPARYVVVTHQSDHELGERSFGARPWNVTEWFGANATCARPGCHGLPLGFADAACTVTVKLEALRALPDPSQRAGWLYVNHRAATNPAVRGPLYAMFQSPSRRAWATVDEPGNDPSAYLAGLARHRFVLCPPGHGIDTHRMWEALYAGCYPVVLRSRVTESVSDGLPVMMVDDFARLDRPALEAFAQRAAVTAWDFRRLTAGWWRERFAEAVGRAQARSTAGLLREWLARKLKSSRG